MSPIRILFQREEKIGTPIEPAGGHTECDLVWRPLTPARKVRAFASDFSAASVSLSAPMFLRRRSRILIDPVIDLFGEDIAETSIDLVHAVVAVSHWHFFLLLSHSLERMRGYYADPASPRRIAEEIDILSVLTVEGKSSRLSPLLAAGFARVRYGRPASGESLVSPLSPEPWPLTNLVQRGAADFPLVSDARSSRG